MQMKQMPKLKSLLKESKSLGSYWIIDERDGSQALVSAHDLGYDSDMDAEYKTIQITYKDGTIDHVLEPYFKGELGARPASNADIKSR